MSAANIACVVLASGLSERFGNADKMAADLCGKPMLSYVLDTARAVGFGEIFCVSQLRTQAGVTSVKNDNPEYGQGHAVRLGMGAARQSGWETCVIMLGDMPLVDCGHVTRLALKIHKNQCVVSESESVRLPPAIFNLSAMDLILSQDSMSGARNLFEHLNPATVSLDPEASLDVDTPADLARVARIMKARKI